MSAMNIDAAIGLYSSHVKDEDALSERDSLLSAESGESHAKPLQHRGIDDVADAPEPKVVARSENADPKPVRVKDAGAYAQFHAFNWACLVCDRRPVNAAHLIGKGRGGDTVLANLIPLDGSGSSGCHGAYDNGHAYYSAQGEKITPAYVKRCVGFWLLSEAGENARWYVVAKLGTGGSEAFLESLGVQA